MMIRFIPIIFRFHFFTVKPLNIDNMNQTELLNIIEMREINNEQCKALTSSRTLETYVYVSLSFFISLYVFYLACYYQLKGIFITD